MSNQVIYQEQQKTYFILIAVFLVIAVLILILAIFPSFFGLQSLSWAVKIALLIVVLVDAVSFWCFKELTIIVDNENLSFGFGFMKRQFSWNNLKSAQAADFDLKNYLGYGIRFGKDKSIAFAAQGGRGVRLKTTGKDYFFSCTNPEKLANLINEKIKS